MALQTRNSALKNEVVRLYFQFLDNGELANPGQQPLVEILDSDGLSVLDSIPAQRERAGIYYVDWFVPADIETGTYYDRWTYQWRQGSSVEEKVMPINVTTFDNYINFVSRGISNELSPKMFQLLNDLKNFFIYEASHIPMYWEQAMRIQEEGLRKKEVYFYELELEDGVIYNFEVGDTYFHNGQKYVVKTFSPNYKIEDESSSESSCSESSDSSDSSESSVSSSSSSSSSSSEDFSSSFSESSESSESSEGCPKPPSQKSILTVSGYCEPEENGVMTIVKGDGTESFNFILGRSRKSKKSTIYSCVFRNWDREWKPIVRINGRIAEDGWYADYDGKLYFDRVMSPEDVVEVTYKFACFSDNDLVGFLRWGLMQMNAVPPASEAYRSIDQAPAIWNAPILLGAAIQALKRAIFAMTVLQEKRAIYGGADDDEWAKLAMETFKSLYTDYTALWDNASKEVKKRLPKIAINVTPEYTLPGGRSRWFRYLYK